MIALGSISHSDSNDSQRSSRVSGSVWPRAQCIRVDRIVCDRFGEQNLVTLYLSINDGTVSEIECTIEPVLEQATHRLYEE